jgi:hypothetical protein
LEIEKGKKPLPLINTDATDPGKIYRGFARIIADKAKGYKRSESGIGKRVIAVIGKQKNLYHRSTLMPLIQEESTADLRG